MALSPVQVAALVGAGVISTQGGGVDPNAWIRGIVGFDIENGRGFYNGQQYTDFNTWWAAVSGSYTRAGNKRYFDSNGVLQTAAANTWPDEYDPLTKKRIGRTLWPTTTPDSRWGRDLTNAVWTKTNATVAKDQVGADGVASGASSFTATANGALVKQAFVDATARNRGAAALLKRLVGTGPIEISCDEVTFVDVTKDVASGNFSRVHTYLNGIANPILCIRLGTIGDSIAVDFAQLTRTTCAGPPILTDASTEVFSNEVAYIPVVGLVGFNASEGAFAIRSMSDTVRNGGGGDGRWVFSISDGGTTNSLIENTSGAASAFSINNAGSGQFTCTFGTRSVRSHDWDSKKQSLRFAGKWKTNEAQAAVEGQLSDVDTTVNLPTGITRIYLGARGNSGNQFGGYIQEFWVRDTAPTPIELATFSSSLQPVDTQGDSLAIGSAADFNTNNYMSIARNTLATNKPRTFKINGVGGSKIADCIAQYNASVATRDFTHLFWTGTNDAGTGSATAADVIPGYQTLIASMTHNRWAFFTVNTVVGDNADQVAQKNTWNAWLRANVPNNLIDTMAFMLTQGDGSTADNNAIAAGRIPPSLLADTIHFNNKGCALVGGLVRQFLDSKGW